MKKTYIDKKFNKVSLQVLTKINNVIEDYADQGFHYLTVRQIYYKFVANGWIPEQWYDPRTESDNCMKTYGKLQRLINVGRLAGHIDWYAITDITRKVRQNSHWDSPASVVQACIDQYQIDKWENQEYRPEVWIEKDAMIGVIKSVCSNLDVPYFSCRGYTSQSEIWKAARRLLKYTRNDQIPIIIHLGDHDPSGLDMTRDIIERLELLSGNNMRVKRIALNKDQIEEFNPPPNPAKLTDTRANAYIAEFGYESWELDALEPQIIVDLIQDTVEDFKDNGAWVESQEKEQEHINRLREIMKSLD